MGAVRSAGRGEDVQVGEHASAVDVHMEFPLVGGGPINLREVQADGVGGIGRETGDGVGVRAPAFSLVNGGGSGTDHAGGGDGGGSGRRGATGEIRVRGEPSTCAAAGIPANSLSDDAGSAGVVIPVIHGGPIRVKDGTFDVISARGSGRGPIVGVGAILAGGEGLAGPVLLGDASAGSVRSEEHTSELQSQSNLVCR